MSDYNRTSDRFTVKDGLTSGDPDKVILGADVDEELNAAATAINSKYDSADRGAANGICPLDANQIVPEANLGQATEVRRGGAAIATDAEMQTGTNDTDIVTPAKFSTAIGAWTGGVNFSGTVIIGGGTPWTDNNDGAGSGLDADLLDGQQGSYYLDPANITGTVPKAKQDPNTAYLDVHQGFNEGQYVETVEVLESGGNYSCDGRRGNVFRIVLSANGNLLLPALANGQQLVIVVEQQGSFTLSFSGIQWAYGEPPVITTGSGSEDILTITKTATGKVYGTYAQDFS